MHTALSTYNGDPILNAQSMVFDIFMVYFPSADILPIPHPPPPLGSVMHTHFMSTVRSFPSSTSLKNEAKLTRTCHGL